MNDTSVTSESDFDKMRLLLADRNSGPHNTIHTQTDISSQLPLCRFQEYRVHKTVSFDQQLQSNIN